MDNETKNKSDGSAPNAFDLLGQTMQGAESSLSSVSSTLKDSMERSAQMAKTMSLVMQQVIRTNVKVSTTFEPLQEGSKLTVTINNTSAFPVIGLTGTIEFKPAASDDTTELNADHQCMDSISEVPSLTLVSSLQCYATGQPTHTVNSLFLPSYDSKTTNAPPTMLPPNSKHVEVLRIHTSRLIQYNGLIDILIPLPGDDGSDSIHLTNSFGVYLIDQMKKRLSNDRNIQCTEEGDDVPERVYHAQFIRDIYGMNPILGLEKGMLFCLDPLYGEDGLITCRIESISLEDQTVQVRFFGKNKVLVDLLVHELDTLDK